MAGRVGEKDVQDVYIPHAYLGRANASDVAIRELLGKAIAVEPQGELLVKGKPRPINVYAVLVDSLVVETG